MAPFRRPAAVLLVPVLLFGGPAAAQSGDEHAEASRAARSAAASWLALVDDGAFEESWDAAGPLFREPLEREAWLRKAERLRDSVEALSSRRLVHREYRRTLSEVSADGPFVLLKYRSTVNGRRFEELLLTARDDETWTVAGYQVAPLPAPPDSSAATPQ